MNRLQLFLLGLICIGLALLATQKFWVPAVVAEILRHDTPATPQK